MHAIFERLARLMALLGGAALLSLVLLVCLSILGGLLGDALRSDLARGLAPGLASDLLGLGIGPINGNTELVESGMAFTIFAFLPLCQLHGAHASVDVFTARLPERARRALAAAAELLFAAALVLIAWQLWEGLESKRRSGQTSFLLEYPVWWGYAAALSGAAVAALVASYVAGARVAEAASGRAILPDAGAEEGH